jgi:hypothetical protein
LRKKLEMAARIILSFACLTMIAACAVPTPPPSVQAPLQRGGFTGDDVPARMVEGDYHFTGLNQGNNRPDIDGLIGALQYIGVRDYMHLVWDNDRLPDAWADFQTNASIRSGRISGSTSLLQE